MVIYNLIFPLKKKKKKKRKKERKKEHLLIYKLSYTRSNLLPLIDILLNVNISMFSHYLRRLKARQQIS